MKKLICWILGASMLFSLLSTSPAAETETASDFLSTLRSEYTKTSAPGEEIFQDISFSETGYIYGKQEITFQLNLSYTNPFDPEDIAVNGIFTYPDGSTAAIPSFYTEEMAYKTQGTTLMTYNANSYTNTGNSYWCLRFSGDTVGEYRFYIQAITADGSIYQSDEKSFILLDSDNKGFIEISEKNPQYFTDSADGSLFYGTGSNIAWVRDQFTSDPTHRSYEYFLEQASGNGTSLTRVWLCHWAWLEWMPEEGVSSTYSYAGLGYYNQCISSALDNIFAICEEKGLRLILTLDDNDEHKTASDTDGTPTYDSWGFNPYNAENGGPATDTEDYWSNNEVRKHYKNRLRYIIARWGYSSSLMSLNLWNDTTTPTDAITEYLSELNTYTKELTGNYRTLLFASNYKYEATVALDYSTQNTANGNSLGEKPVLTQECYYSEDENYFKSTLKNTLWDELFSFSAATMVWSHDTVDETDSWSLFKGLLNFTDRIPLNRYTYLPHYSIKSFAGTWEDNGITPTLSIEKGRLNITTGPTATSFATVKLDNPQFSPDTVGISFRYDATALTQNANLRINLQTKINGETHIYMPWFGGAYSFTPEGGEAQTLTVSGKEQWKSFLKVFPGTEGTYYIPFSTFNIPEELTSSTDINSKYKFNIFEDSGNDFEFVVQQQATSEGKKAVSVDDICWVGADYSLTAQNFSNYTASYPLSADYSLSNTEGFKNITAKALGDVAGWAQKATENQFTVNETDSDLLFAGISSKLYGTNKSVSEYRNDPTFTVNCTEGGEMVIELSEIGSGTNLLTFTENNQVVKQVSLTGGRRYVTDDERYISIELEPGTNVITISNEGNDWIAVSGYHFKFYMENTEECVSVKRMISDNQQLALVKNSRSGEIYQKVFSGTPDTALNVTVPFYYLKKGDYRFEIYNTETGYAEHCRIVSVSDDSYIATLPQVEDSKALLLTEYLAGDVNDSGSFEITDIVRLKKHIAGIKSQINYGNSDPDLDGIINILDLSLLRSELLEK